jgi:cytoskeletal protein CcmA (bactofilin family)
LTSPTIGGHAVIEGVTPTGATGTGNLVFSAGPTLTGTLAAATITASGTLSVTGNTTISGSLTTTDITTTGNHSVTGNITAQGTVFSDKIKSPATNADLAISAQGTGIVDIQSAMTTIGQTITGTASVTGQFNADNLRIDGNTISSTDTNGNISITPNGNGLITLGSSNTVQAYNIAVTNLSVTEVDVSGNMNTDSIRSRSSNADIVVQPQGTGTVDFKVPAQSTVGAAGAASALPANPTGYFKIKVNGSTFVVPYYAQ